MPATSSRWPASRRRAPATRCAIRAEAGHPGEDGIPRAGHRDRDRAEDQGRPGEARRGARQARGRGPVVPRLDRPGVGPDHHQGHGRAAPRHQGRHPASAPTRSRPMSARRRWPIARRSRKPADDRLHAQEADRRHRPVRARQDRRRAERAGRGLRVREQDRRRRGAEGVHPRRREGPRSRCWARACSPASRWSTSRSR